VSCLLIDLTAEPGLAGEAAGRLDGPVESIVYSELRPLGFAGIWRRLRRRRLERSVVLVPELRTPGRWLSMVLLALLPRARRRTIMDRDGQEVPVSWARLLTDEIPFCVRRRRITRRVAQRCAAAAGSLRPAGRPAPLRPRRVAFIRADLGPALTAGGSLAHIRGVVGGFESRGCAVELLTPAPIAGFKDDRLHLIPAPEADRLSVELPHLAYNDTLLSRAVELLPERGVDLVYQRHALGCHAGASAAEALALPLVLEFNGSEVWIARHWGAARRQLELFEEIERRTLQAADLIVAVSAALKDPLLALGVPEQRILINPNGVDTDRFDPDRLQQERGRIRRRLGVGADQLLAGFVGTFGPWHGAEVLAEAIGNVEASSPTRFLFIGDGPRRRQAEAILDRNGRADRVTFTGMVGFDETPGLLAACDLCLSPHVPNPDGSPFFGSPTKLFEYMASGRPVIASELGQIGEVLRHDRTAWLVPPGDPGSLAQAIVELERRPELRERLGREARRDAERAHSWAAHVDRILERLASGGENAS